MTAALFRRCGIALFGPDPIWKAPLGVALGVKTDSIDAWAKGASRIPPGVWRDLFALLERRRVEIDAALAAKESAIQIAELGTQRG